MEIENVINIKKNFIKTKDDFEEYLDKKLNKKLDDYTNLIHLTITKNYLSSIELSKILNLNEKAFTDLNYINLAANDLTEIPKQFNNFVNLKTLILNTNKIKQIENLNNLKNLERLELRSNRITKLKNLNELTSLKIFTISCNLITCVDKNSIGKWSELEDLGLFGNFLGNELNEEENKKAFDELTTIISTNLPKLKSFYIGGNYFSKLEDFESLIKKRLPNLISLDGIQI